MPKLRSLPLPLFALGAALALACPRVAVAADPDALTPLPEFPVCEASAIVGFPCATAAGKACVLVGDNEEKATLFEYTVGPSGLLSKSPAWARTLADGSVEDVEALVRLDGDVVVVGSHSRKKDCTRDEKRLRLLRARSGSGSDLTSAAKIRLEDPKRWSARLRACARELIRLPEGSSEELVSLRDGVCRAIAEAETAAGEKERPKADEEGRAKCAETFNVEGALVLREAGSDRLWLGLRAPLFEKQAILLRVADLASSDAGVRFDGVATIDLGGLGIRELAADADWIYGISGSMQDGGTSALWRVPVTSLEGGARITGVHTFVPDLPGGAEGLFVQSPPGRALIVIDGEKSGAGCKDAAQQVVTGVPVYRRVMR